jgi:hypothetical protein
LQAPQNNALPPQLLALVLVRVQQAERLSTMASVCSTWHTASVIATHSISLHSRKNWADRDGLVQDKLTGLSGWLQAHAAAAAVDSLAVTADYYTGDPLPTLQLPVQQLASLRSLDLVHLAVTAQGAPSTKASTLPSELSAITRLRCCTAV